MGNEDDQIRTIHLALRPNANASQPPSAQPAARPLPTRPVTSTPPVTSGLPSPPQPHLHPNEQNNLAQEHIRALQMRMAETRPQTQRVLQAARPFGYSPVPAPIMPQQPSPSDPTGSTASNFRIDGRNSTTTTSDTIGPNGERTRVTINRTVQQFPPGSNTPAPPYGLPPQLGSQQHRPQSMQTNTLPANFLSTPAARRIAELEVNLQRGQFPTSAEILSIERQLHTTNYLGRGIPPQEIANLDGRVAALVRNGTIGDTPPAPDTNAPAQSAQTTTAPAAASSTTATTTPTPARDVPSATSTREPIPTQVFLVSSPTGSQALIFSPEAGLATGFHPRSPWRRAHPAFAGGNVFSPPILRSGANGASNDVDQRPAAAVPEDHAAHAAPAAPNAPNADRPRRHHHARGGRQEQRPSLLVGLIRRMWLFVRLYFFAYFFSESGSWRRILMITFAVLSALLVDTGFVTRVRELLWAPIAQHMDGLVPLDERQPPRNDGARRESGQANGVRPVDLAERLLRQQAEARDARGIRSFLRTIERAVALFVASLIPGVGERHIEVVNAAQAAREAAERRQEEEEAQARAEEQKRRAEEEEKTHGDEKTKEGEPSPKQSEGIGSSSSTAQTARLSDNTLT